MPIHLRRGPRTHARSGPWLPDWTHAEHWCGCAGRWEVGRAAAFWCEALGYEIRTDGFGGWAAVLTPPAGGAGTKIALQRNETPPQDHPRLHLDLHVSSAAEQRAEAARLMAIGAEPVSWDSYPDDPDFIVLADPDGNRFCIVDLSHAPD